MVKIDDRGNLVAGAGLPHPLGNEGDILRNNIPGTPTWSAPLAPEVVWDWRSASTFTTQEMSYAPYKMLHILIAVEGGRIQLKSKYGWSEYKGTVGDRHNVYGEAYDTRTDTWGIITPTPYAPDVNETLHTHAQIRLYKANRNGIDFWIGDMRYSQPRKFSMGMLAIVGHTWQFGCESTTTWNAHTCLGFR